jgi:hypothetical protein
MSRALRVSIAVLSLALLAALATWSWRGWYARYFLDDYCTAADLHDYGFAGAMQHHREAWSGRYSYFVFKAALESMGPATARATPTLMMLLLAFAFWWTLRRVLSARVALVLAVLACTFTIFDASPSMLNTDETYFWETGYVTYVLPLVLLTLWLRWFVSGRSIAFCSAVSAVLLFVAGGFSETSLAAQGALCGGLLIVALVLRNRRAAWISASGLIATLASLAIVASAPGNAVRASTLTARISLPAAALRALRFANGFVGSYLFLAGAAFLVILGAGFVAGLCSPRIRPRVAAAFALVALAAYAISFLPAAWLLSTPPPPASLDVASYCLMLALFAAAVGLGGRSSRRVEDPSTRFAVPLLLLVLAIVPLWSVVSNVRAIPRDREKGLRMDALDASLRAQRGQDVVVRERWPSSMHILDVDANHWSNRCVSRYYELRSVRVAR